MRNLLICAVCCAVLAGGCVTSTVKHVRAEKGTTTADGRKVVAYMQGMNSGMFLFYYIANVRYEFRFINRLEAINFQLDPQTFKGGFRTFMPY